MTIETTAPLPADRNRVASVRLRAGEVAAISLAIVINLALVVGVFWIATHPQRAVDQIAVWQFTPSTAIETYAERASMSDEGRFLFFASRPVIATNADFNDVCSTQLENVGILGCYLPNDKTIYLYDVTDDRLDGIEEVVAAHELLHAAWDRMSGSERADLAVLLEAEAAKHADDPGFIETMAFYERAEPGERSNELHSIVGTEFDDLSPALETHYAQYFDTRADVVALHTKSNAVFEAQTAAVDALVSEIDELAASIDTDYASYNSRYGQLNADIDSFNSRADSGDFASQSEFNAERAALLARKSVLDALYATIDARQTQYNELVNQLDKLNSAVAQLNEAINITPHESAGTTG